MVDACAEGGERVLRETSSAAVGGDCGGGGGAQQASSAARSSGSRHPAAPRAGARHQDTSPCGWAGPSRAEPGGRGHVTHPDSNQSRIMIGPSPLPLVHGLDSPRQQGPAPHGGPGSARPTVLTLTLAWQWILTQSPEQASITARAAVGDRLGYVPGLTPSPTPEHPAHHTARPARLGPRIRSVRRRREAQLVHSRRNRRGVWLCTGRLGKKWDG
jgi:hypothetical protein